MLDKKSYRMSLLCILLLLVGFRDWEALCHLHLIAPSVQVISRFDQPHVTLGFVAPKDSIPQVQLEKLLQIQTLKPGASAMTDPMRSHAWFKTVFLSLGNF